MAFNVHDTFVGRSIDHYGEWSPDDARLLVGTFGYGSSSTSAFLDYFVLDLATRRWARGFSGNDAAWLPDGRRIVFTTPRELSPLPGTTKHVWTTQLAVFDLATGTVTALTSDAANNDGLTVCGAR
jgi:Tol biopolymer transport system component